MYLQEILGGQEKPVQKTREKDEKSKNATTFLRGRKIIKEKYKIKLSRTKGSVTTENDSQTKQPISYM